MLHMERPIRPPSQKPNEGKTGRKKPYPGKESQYSMIQASLYLLGGSGG